MKPLPSSHETETLPIEDVAILHPCRGFAELDADARSGTGGRRRIRRSESRSQPGKPVNSGSLNEVVLRTGVGIHHLYGGVRIPKVVRIDEDEVWGISGDEPRHDEQE